MTSHLKIDFVSDVSCPWCVIGLRSLEQALERIGDETTADIDFQPFELNPQMPSEGQDIVEHIAQKYGSTPEQFVRNQEGIRARGAALGFAFNLDKRFRIYNTFDAHRLLHWADLEGRQHAFQRALFAAYFTEGRDPSDREVLIDVATQAGLDAVRTREILESGLYADEVREREQFYARQGIHAVPSVIVNDKYLIQGGQLVEVFEQALRKIAAELATLGHLNVTHRSRLVAPARHAAAGSLFLADLVASGRANGLDHADRTARRRASALPDEGSPRVVGRRQRARPLRLHAHQVRRPPAIGSVA